MTSRTSRSRDFATSTHARPTARDYDYYEQLYNPDAHVPDQPHVPVRTKSRQKAAAIVANLTDEAMGGEAGFTTTYNPARHEEGWLMSSLGLFYANDLITDVLAMVKGGKEATVYRCRGTRAAEYDIVAAKVYRPRQFRNLRNDKMYKEGRRVLTADGRPVKATDQRLIRALNKKTAFGKQVEHTSWLMYEFTTLQQLYAAGVAVPKPIATSENAILMEHIGSADITAPTLHEVSLAYPEAQALFDTTLIHIERMLAAGMVHGDLSAYNILYWEGEICLIDFPQVTYSLTNSNARSVFFRDVQRVCEYFASQGVDSNPRALAYTLWNRYETQREADRLAELSRHAPTDEE
ncbi:MAG: RIO1 family regulatory kinase/ATPase [Litorilinea sp.]